MESFPQMRAAEFLRRKGSRARQGARQFSGSELELSLAFSGTRNVTWQPAAELRATARSSLADGPEKAATAACLKGATVKSQLQEKYQL
jgi:hypothetical protein